MFFFFRCTAQLTNQAARSRAPLEELIWNQVFNLAWKCKGKASLRKKRLLQKLIKCGEPAPLLSFLGALDKSWNRLYLNFRLVFSKNHDFLIKTCRLIFTGPPLKISLNWPSTKLCWLPPLNFPSVEIVSRSSDWPSLFHPVQNMKYPSTSICVVLFAKNCFLKQWLL